LRTLASWTICSSSCPPSPRGSGNCRRPVSLRREATGCFPAEGWCA
jgi:hypothetical protein